MPYGITDADIEAVAAKLLAEYDERWQAGIYSVMDRMAASSVKDTGLHGIISKKANLAMTSFTSFKREWDQNFNTPLRSKLTRELNVQTGNKMDLVNLGVTVAVKALKAGLGKIPVPLVGTILSAGVDLAAGIGQGVVADKATVEADTKLAARTGSEPIAALSISERDVVEYAKASMDLYKEIAKLVDSAPKELTDFDDIVTYPGVAWRIQKSASTLNISLDALMQYLRQMEARVSAVQKALATAQATVRTGMKPSIVSVMQTTYQQGFSQGITDYGAQNYKNFAEPARQTVTEPGPAPHMAMLMAWAFASGYWDAPRTETRARSSAVISRPAPTGPPLPPRRPLPPIPGTPPTSPVTPPPPTFAGGTPGGDRRSSLSIGRRP